MKKIAVVTFCLFLLSLSAVAMGSKNDQSVWLHIQGREPIQLICGDPVEEKTYQLGSCPAHPQMGINMKLGVFFEHTIEPCDNTFGNPPFNGFGEFPCYEHEVEAKCPKCGRTITGRYFSIIIPVDTGIKPPDWCPKCRHCCCVASFPGPCPKEGLLRAQLSLTKDLSVVSETKTTTWGKLKKG